MFDFKNRRVLGQVKTADVSNIADIADFFPPTFINPSFRFLPVVKYENLDHKKSEIFRHRISFRYSPIVNIENLDFKNP